MALAEMQFFGLSEFRAAIQETVAKVDAAGKAAVMEGALIIETEAKKNASGPARWRKGVNSPRSGGPGVVTGTGRRSYHTEGPVRAGAGWAAKVGPSAMHMVYVELGTSRGIPANTYQALVPAVAKVQPRLAEVWSRHWAGAVT